MRASKGRAAGAAIMFAVGAVLLLLACSSDNAGPTNGVLGSSRSPGDIYGYTYDNLNNPLGGVYVV